MRPDVVSATPRTDVGDLATMMRDESVGSVVITEDRRPVGIVTDRDLALNAIDGELDPASMTAEDLMTRNLTTIDVDAGVFDLTARMREEQVRRMPVTEDGELVGIVTLDDLLVLLSGELRNIGVVIEKESPAYPVP